MSDMLRKRAMHPNPRDGSSPYSQSQPSTPANRAQIDSILAQSRSDLVNSPQSSQISRASDTFHTARTFEVNTEKGGRALMSEEEVTSLVHNALRRARQATSETSPSMSPRHRNRSSHVNALSPTITGGGSNGAKLLPTSSLTKSSIFFPSDGEIQSESSYSLGGGSRYGGSNRVGLPAKYSSRAADSSINSEDPFATPAGSHDSLPDGINPTISNISVDASDYRAHSDVLSEAATDDSFSEHPMLTSVNSSDAIIRRVEEEISNARKAAQEANRRLAGVSANLRLSNLGKHLTINSHSTDSSQEIIDVKDMESEDDMHDHYDTAMDVLAKEFDIHENSLEQQAYQTADPSADIAESSSIPQETYMMTTGTYTSDQASLVEDPSMDAKYRHEAASSISAGSDGEWISLEARSVEQEDPSEHWPVIVPSSSSQSAVALKYTSEDQSEEPSVVVPFESEIVDKARYSTNHSYDMSMPEDERESYDEQQFIAPDPPGGQSQDPSIEQVESVPQEGIYAKRELEAEEKRAIDAVEKPATTAFPDRFSSHFTRQLGQVDGGNKKKKPETEATKEYTGSEAAVEFTPAPSNSYEAPSSHPMPSLDDMSSTDEPQVYEAPAVEMSDGDEESSCLDGDYDLLTKSVVSHEIVLEATEDSFEIEVAAASPKPEDDVQSVDFEETIGSTEAAAETLGTAACSEPVPSYESERMIEEGLSSDGSDQEYSPIQECRRTVEINDQGIALSIQLDSEGGDGFELTAALSSSYESYDYQEASTEMKMENKEEVATRSRDSEDIEDCDSKLVTKPSHEEVDAKLSADTVISDIAQEGRIEDSDEEPEYDEIVAPSTKESVSTEKPTSAKNDDKEDKTIESTSATAYLTDNSITPSISTSGDVDSPSRTHLQSTMTPVDEIPMSATDVSVEINETILAELRSSDQVDNSKYETVDENDTEPEEKSSIGAADPHAVNPMADDEPKAPNDYLHESKQSEEPVVSNNISTEVLASTSEVELPSLEEKTGHIEDDAVDTKGVKIIQDEVVETSEVEKEASEAAHFEVTEEAKQGANQLSRAESASKIATKYWWKEQELEQQAGAGDVKSEEKILQDSTVEKTRSEPSKDGVLDQAETAPSSSSISSFRDRAPSPQREDFVGHQREDRSMAVEARSVPVRVSSTPKAVQKQAALHSNKVRFKQRYPVPPLISNPRPGEEIIKDHRIPPTGNAVFLSTPKPDLKELLEAVMGPSLPRRSNACGALKVLTLQNKNKLTLVRTVGVLDALVFATTAKISHRDFESAIDARTRAVTTICNVAEPKDNREIVVNHPGLPVALVKTAIEDKAEARTAACGALALLAKTPLNRERMAKTRNLINVLAMILRGGKSDPDLLDVKPNYSADDEGSTGNSYCSGSESSSSSLEAGSSLSQEEDDITSPTVMSMREQKKDKGDEIAKRGQLNACAALLHLSKQCGATPLMCYNGQLMDALIEVTHRKNDPMHTKCLEIICNLTRFPDNNEHMAKYPGVVDTLVVSGGSSVPLDRVWALRTLQNLSSNVTGKTVLANRVVLELLSISVMRDALEEQLAATATLYNLSTEPGAVVPLTNTKNVVATLVHVAHNPDSPSQVRVMACDALATLGLWLQTLAGAGTVPGDLNENVALPSYVTTGWKRWEN